MKLADFILLNEHGKKQAVLNEGILIAKRKEPASIIFLFQVQNFYVEACFNSCNKHIEEFRMFSGTGLLQPYLDNMPIDDLLN